MNDYLSLYEGNISYRESVTFKYDDNGIAKANLLHKIKSVICIENLSGNIKYSGLKDYTVEENCIVLTKNTSIKVLDKYFPKKKYVDEKPYYKHIDGEFLFFAKGGTMQYLQVFVTYEIKERAKIYKPKRNDRLTSLLENKHLKVVVYGDSISLGHSTLASDS